MSETTMSKSATAVRVFVGAVLLGIFAASQFMELKSPPVHPWHVVVFSIGMTFAAVLAIGRPAVLIVQRVSIAVLPYVPMIGGRRASDPPVVPITATKKKRSPKKHDVG